MRAVLLLFVLGSSAIAAETHWAFQPLHPADSNPLAPHPDADQAASRNVLIRRLSFDLCGLPPSPEEVSSFVSDNAPDAWERRVDQMLARPQFGERQGRHWLDVARYADSRGYENDGDRPTAWHYRDWVIKALNDDLPFDSFIHWQLAGDELAPDNVEASLATAFLGMGPEMETSTKLPDELARYRYADLDDMVSTTSQAVLGLTMGCARCHDHKIDPVSQREYHGLVAAFVNCNRRELPLRPGTKETAFSLTDKSSTPVANPLMKRGDPMSPGEEIPFGFPAVLTKDKTASDFLANLKEKVKSTTGRRAALALWLTDPVHGAGQLAARVAANRLWQHHFGEGLVRTPGDFGKQGEAPSDPALLDWLASELIRNGWRQKPLHRAILLSPQYQSARRKPLRLDAESLRDTLLEVSGTLNKQSGGPGVRAPIPAESNTAYQPKDPYPIDARDTPETRRRSVYLFTKRSLRQPLLEIFDGADPSASCQRRLPTSVAPQALALLNDPFIRTLATDFAARLSKECGPDPDKCITRAWQLALSRNPAAPDLAAARDLILRQQTSRRRHGSKNPDMEALADFCQAVFAMNEFIYVE